MVRFSCSFRFVLRLGQLWAFYRRILEDRPVWLAEFFRVSRTGFRVMSMIGQPFGKLYRLKRRWLRLWLIIYHPSTPWGLPWYWWFSAGRREPIPYEAIGVLYSQLLNDRYQELSGDGWTIDDARMDPAPYWEECVRHPWLNMHPNQLKDTCLRPINGDLIDPLLESTKTKNNLYRRRNEK